MLVLFVVGLSHSAFSQTEQEFLSKALGYLNENMDLKLAREPKPVLIAYEGFYYLCLDYTTCDSIVSFEKMEKRLLLKKVAENKYWFRYIYGSTREGEFEVVKDGDAFIFENLHYVMYIE